MNQRKGYEYMVLTDMDDDTEEEKERDFIMIELAFFKKYIFLTGKAQKCWEEALKTKEEQEEDYKKYLERDKNGS